MINTKRALSIIDSLKVLYPNSQTILRWKKPWQLVIAVMLSAQTTDVKVNEVTAVLFKKYQSLKALSLASEYDIAKIIHAVNYNKTKAKNVVATAKMLREQCKGKVPSSLEELVLLPGVGRKTANVVLGNLFGSEKGIAVDTHVHRLARLWGLVKGDTPARIEEELLMLIPEGERHLFTNRCIDYGRQQCAARCTHTQCPLRKYVANGDKQV
ncbi:MAG: endonuclease III [bacterium]|nr:endonuclease III [bacterium]